ncbi:hypothetical protein CC86DRAFT_461410 [Ophiobolus disseminans]|uniref:Trafficking protein particle complex II-specific subunit 65 IgD3 domain-containing protein n=1 Tax=Ophiobolus disseminans TaxID=1469910 RepID=A0A6A7AJU4_9PLEO|nr:hypothetical protein CC86DRAFT_461410 [Ophiobolus disseminans]
MATSPGEPRTRTSAEFVESSVLEAVVPASSDIDLEDELQSWDGKNDDESGSILPFLLQRNVLLLDELLPVYVAFRTPLVDDETLKLYLARLVLNLEGYAFSTSPPPEGEPKPGPTKELIYSSTIKDTDEPTVVRHGKGDESHTYVFWKVKAFISRPQGRFHKPAVYFQPTASFKPASTPQKTDPEDEYLPNCVPTALNLLQAFENDPALAGVHPRLSAMRINKMAPSAAPVIREMVRPIRSGQRPLFRILPALIWRVRYAKVHTNINDLSLLASLDLEVASYATYDVLLKSVNLTLHGGTVQPYVNGPQDSEAVYKPGDQLTYIYKITPDIASDGTPTLGTKGHFLTMHVSASVLMSAATHPAIAITWNTPVDFASASQHSPNLLKAAHTLSTPSTNNPDALPPVDDAATAPTSAINVTLTISGPPRVRTGEVFTWTVFIVNRSKTIRKLAIRIIPKRSPQQLASQSSHTQPHPSSSPPPSPPSSPSTKKPLLAPAIVDENILYAQQKGARTATAELVCLTTDIRVGQLAPGSCFTAEVKFLATGRGVLGIEGVRVLDLGSGEVVLGRDVPSVVAVGEGEEDEDRE